jgi:hypothetical protein
VFAGAIVVMCDAAACTVIQRQTKGDAAS